jgi:Cu-processing system permease protein
MNASTAPLGVLPSGARDENRVHVSSKWRTGQVVVSGLILLTAIYYNLAGWQSPAGELRVADSRTIFDQLGFLVLLALTWMTTPAAGVIATTTFQEAIRRRWMSALLAFAIVMMALSTFFMQLQPGEEEKFLRDFGMGFIVIITLLMAIFLGVALVPPEIERRTIFTILSKPVDRLEFLIGKFLGLAITLLMNLVILSIMFLVAYTLFALRRAGWSAHDAFGPHPGHQSLAFNLANLACALGLQFGLLLIMAALSLCTSLLLNGITAIVACFVVYFGGQATAFLEHLSQGQSGRNLSAPVLAIIRGMTFVLPRLDRFDVRERLINEMPVAFNYIWKAFGSSLLYVTALMAIAYFLFSEREF